jgi:hypothetical protein
MLFEIQREKKNQKNRNKRVLCVPNTHSPCDVLGASRDPANTHDSECEKRKNIKSGERSEECC